MNFIFKIWEKIKEPKVMYLVLFYIFFVLCVAGTILLVVLVPEQTIGHYVLYLVASVSLAYFVYTMFYCIPKIKSAIIKTMQRFEFTRKLLSDYGYRAIVLGVLAFIINFSFVVVQGVVAILSLSVWYGALTIYFLVLGTMRGSLLYSKRKYLSKETEIKYEKQTKTYLVTGIMLIVSTLAFSGIMVLALQSNNAFEYSGLMIYVVATYTFYKLSLSIYNLFKVKKVEDLYVKSLKNISFAESLISIVALQMAMFNAFAPEMSLASFRIANASVGGIVSAVVIGIGIYMIIKATKRRKNSEEQK